MGGRALGIASDIRRLRRRLQLRCGPRLRAGRVRHRHRLDLAALRPLDVHLLRTGGVHGTARRPLWAPTSPASGSRRARARPVGDKPGSKPVAGDDDLRPRRGHRRGMRLCADGLRRRRMVRAAPHGRARCVGCRHRAGPARRCAVGGMADRALRLAGHLPGARRRGDGFARAGGNRRSPAAGSRTAERHAITAKARAQPALLAAVPVDAPAELQPVRPHHLHQ